MSNVGDREKYLIYLDVASSKTSLKNHFEKNHIQHSYNSSRLILKGDIKSYTYLVKLNLKQKEIRKQTFYKMSTRIQNVLVQ